MVVKTEVILLFFFVGAAFGPEIIEYGLKFYTVVRRKKGALTRYWATRPAPADVVELARYHSQPEATSQGQALKQAA